MSAKRDEFESRIAADLARLAGQVQEGPSQRQLISARHRRTGRKLAGLGVAASILAATILGLLFSVPRESRVDPGLSRGDPLEPLEAHSDTDTQRRRLRQALTSLGIDRGVVIEKLPCGRISFVAASGQVDDPRQLDKAFERLFRNFTSAMVEVRDGQMQISLLTSTTGSAVDRRPLAGEDR
jgi:hypothetical protein